MHEFLDFEIELRSSNSWWRHFRATRHIHTYTVSVVFLVLVRCFHKGMEKLSFVKNGVLRLPPGFRFHPTDEELVVQYLKRKVFACPLPASIIPEVDVCKSDPWDLPG